MKKKWKKHSEMTQEDWAEAREQRTRGLEEAAAKLNAGIEALIRSGKWGDYLIFCSKFYRYSFFNTMLIMLQNPGATHVASFTSWKRMGRHVLKGERGMDIFVPIFARSGRKKAGSEEEVETGPETQILEAGAEEDAATGGGKVLVGFRIGKVFDLAQTDGDPIPEQPLSLLQGDDHGLVRALTDYAVSQGITFHAAGSLGGANGVCMHGPDGKAAAIAILESLPPAQKAKTLAHELGHAALHSELEYRAHASSSIMELEAESVAFMVTNHFDIDSGAYSFGYLVSWGGGQQAIELIKEHGDRIYKCAFAIITWVEETYGPASGGIPLEIPVTVDADLKGALVNA